MGQSWASRASPVRIATRLKGVGGFLLEYSSTRPRYRGSASRDRCESYNRTLSGRICRPTPLEMDDNWDLADSNKANTQDACRNLKPMQSAQSQHSAATTAPSRTCSKHIVACIALSFGVLVTQSGCTSIAEWSANGFKVGPNYAKPAAPVSMEWIDLAEDPRFDATTPDVAAWWRVFNDPVLDDLIQSTYEQNLTLRQAGTRIAQATAIRGIAAGFVFPQVQFAEGGFQRVQTSQNVAVPSPIVRFDQVNTGLSAGWELDFWGRFRRGVEAADANLDASVEDYDDVLVLLLSDVAATYVEIRSLQRRLELTRDNVAAQTNTLAIAQTRFQTGQTNKLDVNQGQNNVNVTEATIPTIEAKLRFANNRLCVLLGLPPQDIVSQLPPGPIPSVGESVQVGIPADLLRRRPDIRRSERLMKAQSERIGIAEADFYPRISLFGSIEWQAENASDLFEPASLFGIVGPTFSWNILNYGRLFNSVANEEAKFEELVYVYQQNVLTAQQEVEDSMIGFVKSKEQYVKLASAVEQAVEAETIVTDLYTTGARDFTSVYQVQAFKFTQQDLLATVKADQAFSLIQLYRALGGGWQIRLPQEVFFEDIGPTDGAIPGPDTPEEETEVNPITDPNAALDANEVFAMESGRVDYQPLMSSRIQVEELAR